MDANLWEMREEMREPANNDWKKKWELAKNSCNKKCWPS
jgi:hypothetical protein